MARVGCSVSGKIMAALTFTSFNFSEHDCGNGVDVNRVGRHSRALHHRSVGFGSHLGESVSVSQPLLASQNSVSCSLEPRHGVRTILVTVYILVFALEPVARLWGRCIVCSQPAAGFNAPCRAFEIHTPDLTDYRT